MPYSDWDLYNCSEDHEEDYVVGLYHEDNHDEIRKFLRANCKDNTIYKMRHDTLYELIEDKLGFTRE